jgi:pimeloyl-ACP methyl ester carboxylesterase
MRLRRIAFIAAAAAGLALLRRSRAGRRAAATDPEAEAPLRISRLGRRFDPYPLIPSGAPVPPSLPQAEIVAVTGRGEMFFRRTEHPTGIPVLLLHGWMASADLNWFRLYEPLGEHHPLIAPDLRGHGRGIRDPHRFSLEAWGGEVGALLRHLGIGPVVAVGYSMGGPVATLLWKRHPELVSGLVLEATGLEWQETWQERLTWRLMWLVAMLFRWDTGRYLLARASGGGTIEVPESLHEYRAWLEGEFRRGDPTDLAEAGRALGRYDARPFAHAIDVPTAVVVTTRDKLVDPRKQYELAAAVGAKVFEFTGDHTTAVLEQQAFAEVTLGAIASVSGEVEASTAAH